MKGLSIKVKAFIVSTLIMGLFIGLGGIGIYTVELLGGSIRDLSQQSVPAVRHMTMVSMMHDRAHGIVYKSLVSGTAEKEEINTDFKQTLVNMDHHLSALNKLQLHPEQITLIAEARKLIEQYREDGQFIIDTATQGDVTFAHTRLDEFNKSFKTIESELGQLGKLFDKAVDTESEQSLGYAEEFKKIMIYFGLFAILSSALISFLSYKSVSGLTNCLIGITQGLKAEAEIIVGTSVSMADVAGKLSEASTQQAASLQETVASIDEISAMITRNADTAQSSSAMSEKSSHMAQIGKEKSQLMLESINAIAAGNEEIIREMQKSNAEISEIVKVIQDIGQKTQVINDIVFQTKLLSFNASVEAARAGEHGKGFAVVAEEVGNLASMSGNAAAEITDMLSKSVKRVTEIVEGTKNLMSSLMKQSKEKVESGAVVVKECTQALDDIVSNVTVVNEMVREISTASQEQATGVREVNKAMSELDQVTQSNSTIAQESSKAANTLQSRADRLNQLVADLTAIVGGKTLATKSVELKVEEHHQENVVPLNAPQQASVTKPEFKKVVGIDFETPKSDDPRFEDV